MLDWLKVPRVEECELQVRPLREIGTPKLVVLGKCVVLQLGWSIQAKYIPHKRTTCHSFT